MNRTELVQAVAERAGVSKSDADSVLSTLATVVGETIAKDEKVTIPGFLTFERAFRAARTALLGGYGRKRWRQRTGFLPRAVTRFDAPAERMSANRVNDHDRGEA